MKTNCCKCVRKILEVLVYLAAGYFCGGCSNTGTCVLHCNVLNASNPDANSETNHLSIKE